MKKIYLNIFVVTILLILVIIFFNLGLDQYLSIDFLKEKKSAIEEFYSINVFLTYLLFFVFYVSITALSLPGAAIMTVAAGAIFGFVKGTIVVSFASTIGATIAFLVSRFLLRSYVQDRFGDKLRVINEGVKREGSFYLFTMRLIPVFPFFLINLLVALTPMSVKKFYITSQVGMLLGTMAYVNAGTQLSKVKTLSGIISPSIILSFVVIGLLPLFFKKIVLIVRKYYEIKT